MDICTAFSGVQEGGAEIAWFEVNAAQAQWFDFMFEGFSDGYVDSRVVN